jgi:hypothetical protein
VFVHTAPRERNTTGPYLDTAATGGLCESASACGNPPQYARRVRAAVLLAVVLALAACGASAAGPGPTPIAFGITGGNLAPYRVTIQPNGSVRVRGSQRMARRRIAPAQVRRLRREIARAGLESRRCPGSLPDVAAQYIRSDGRTITVHGSCEPRFQRVWNELVRAVGI